MSDRVAHRRLYSKIPAFKCKAGCVDCCGPAPASRWERERLPTLPGLDEAADAFRHSLDDAMCPYVGPRGCTVYEKRPMICRLFGASETPTLQCPRGCGPARKLTPEQERALMAEYVALT